MDKHHFFCAGDGHQYDASIRAENPPDGFGLDDVNLIEILPPAFTTQPPTNLTALVGSTVVISATAGGTAPLAYQWLQNGVSLGNAAGISGATTPSLMLAGVTTNNTANYTLVVTNAYGAITSSVAAFDCRAAARHLGCCRQFWGRCDA